MQYTIRGVQPALDREIRERARAEGKSINDVALEALADGMGLGEDKIPRRDLNDITGTWKKDSAFDDAIAEQDRIDPSLWK
jgi:hypothetical protein